MSRTLTLRKVEQEIAEGKLGIARDRLNGLVQAFPDDLSLRSRLAYVYDRLGYPRLAGQFWFLDSVHEPHQLAAVDAFIQECQSDPATILRRLKLRCGPEVLSDLAARAKVEALIEDCKRRGQSIPTFEPRQPAKLPKECRFWSIGCATLTATVLLLAVIGLVAVFQSLFGK